MSKNSYIENTFEKGLYLDANPNSQPKGTYSYAYNATNRDFEQLNDLGNEHSNRLLVTFPSQIIGHGYIDERDEFLVFCKTGLYLFSVDNPTARFVASDTEFGCDWHLDECNFISPQFKTIDPCAETFVYWSSGCEYFKVNIDEMLNETRKASLKESMKPEKDQCSDITCEYFKVFKLSCQPRVTPVAYQQGGGGLFAGAYQFSVKLKNNEGGETNWFTVTEPVYIGGENNVGGEITNGLIEINLSSLDCNYDFGELAVIKTIAGKVTASLVTTFNYVNGKFSYTYVGNEEIPIAIDEIITKGKTYIQGQDLIQYNGNMLYYNIRQTKNLNFQKRVIDEVDTFWVKYRMPYETVSRYNIKSYMRGESYGFGIKYNSVDGRSTRVFHIPAKAGGSDGGNSAAGTVNSYTSTGTINVTQDSEYKRDRNPRDNTVSNLELNEQDTTNLENVDAITTRSSHLCTGASDCEDCAIAAAQCSSDTPPIDDIIADQGAVIASLGSEDDTTVDYSASNPWEAAKAVLDSVINRERTEQIGKKISVTKDDQFIMGSGSETLTGTSNYSGPLFDSQGNCEVDITLERISLGRTIIREEEDIVYSDQKDCEGEYIWGDLANQKVRHHRVPWASKVAHYISNSVGVPSKATPDADEYKDAYVDIIGVQFSNIPIPTEEELGFKLCEANPYTICQIPRTTKNKTIHSKGILTSTLESTNDGKAYLYPTHGLNSEDSIVNRYIKVGDSRRDPNAVPGSGYNFWSLDTMLKAHALNVNDFQVEGIVSGIGYRHGTNEVGKEPADSKYGSRIDQLGTRQAINLNAFAPVTNNWPIDYKTYAQANEVISAPFGATAPLMNKYQQESAWVGISGLTPMLDKSFKGDVLDHNAPISNARAYYGALVRDLPNQYGDLTNMVYIPILEGGVNSPNSVQGFCGDSFIGPHSFIRTSYVSDKVGNYFPIANMVPGKAERCICDTPEDAVHSLFGQWVHSTLPKDGDKADAKNWAGLHTDSTSKTWRLANNALPVSDYYYPRVVKTLITYWGEFDSNPHMRQRGELLEEQVYNKIKSKYGLDSSVNSNSGDGWENDYINQFYSEVQQPSKWKLEKKVIYKSIIHALAPILGVVEILTPETAFEFIGELGSAGILIAIWSALSKVLFTNKYLDEFLGIPACKTDDEGGQKDAFITNFFKNYNRYNSDFNIQNKIEAFYGIPIPYYTCDCDDCFDTTTNEIFISDEQRQGSQLDGYSIVRPKSYVNIPASFGGLTDIFIDNTNLYAHTTDQIIPLRYGRTAVPSDISDIILGPGPILAKPIGMSEGTAEGFAGLLSKQHAINTQYGRFFVDYKASKVYKFQGQLQDISNGIYTHLRGRLKYCESGECENEHTNPNDLALGVDPRFERLLLTKRAISEDQSWTMSFDILSNHWVSFHAYKPHSYLWDRYNMLSVDDTNVWIHDVKNQYQTFMGKYNPYVLEFIINDRDLISDTYSGGFLDTIADKGNLRNRNVTFNKVWFRNPNQTTGYVNIIPIIDELTEDKELLDSEIPEIKFSRKLSMWAYNGLADLAADFNSPMYTSKPCSIEIEPTNLVPYSDSITFKNNIQINNYLIVRFIFDNFDDYKLYTNRHMCHVKKQQEFIQ